MSRRFFLELLLYTLLLLGLGTLEGGILALAVPLLLYLVTALVGAPSRPHLHARRTLYRRDAGAVGPTERVTEAVPVVVQLEITNDGHAVSQLRIQDEVPAGLDVIDGETEVLAPLAAGRTLTLTYTVRGRRGNFNFQQVRVTVWDVLGLVRRNWRLSAPAYLWVLPEVTRIKPVSIRPHHTHGFAGPIPSGQAGSGVDFYGVREYHFGDPRHRINWRLTARHVDTLFTNEFEQERIADVGLILDAREQVNIRDGEHSLFEHAVRATASLADVFLREGHRVALLSYGRALERTFPGYGKVQRERILHALARARTGDSMVFESFDYLPTRFFPARSQLVIVSPLAQGDLPVLVRLRARGYHLLIVSPDPVAFEARWLPDDSAASLAVRICRMERALLLRRLRQYDIRVVDWSMDEPLDTVIHTALSRTRRSVRMLQGIS